MLLEGTGIALNELLIVDCRLAWDYEGGKDVFVPSCRRGEALVKSHRRPELTSINALCDFCGGSR